MVSGSAGHFKTKMLLRGGNLWANLRCILGSRGRGFLVALIFIVLFLTSKWFLIYTKIRWHEWNIYRWSCASDFGIPQMSLTSELSSEPMFISHAFHPKVGLGNVLFIYASLYGIAKKNNFVPAINRISKIQNAMELDPSFIQPFDLSDCNNLVFGMEECCIYDSSSAEISRLHPGRNVTLWGYFQSFQYFHPEYEKDIRRHFAFKNEILQKAQDARQAAILEAIGKKNENPVRPIVGIHVRRGDILEAAAVKFGHSTPKKEYYANAAKRLEERNVVDPIYIVCTNDLSWARENLPLPDVGFVRNTTPEIDLAILSMSDHLILSVGTYSFFAGYLSHAENIIYYARWPEPGSEYAKMTNLKDFWLPEWIALE